ncbi:hypothetical protein H072_11222 [Dactylellina haptotyla CBS 200.50]|uniref:Uncharacterized protein n=1 Tax=Dactylellina haptotyla (strain CBS 200.50) TaxID=1284197 RepID=S8A2N4_DACHA|nr:hypothetical protein H072_11222 [Dactylellina haptotyla CBS 200.50]
MSQEAEDEDDIPSETTEEKRVRRRAIRHAKAKARSWLGMDGETSSIHSVYSSSSSASITPQEAMEGQLSANFSHTLPLRLPSGRGYKDEARIAKNPKLQLFTPHMYTTFVDALLEDAVWRLESRLIYDRWNRVPKDFFNTLFDDPQEGLPGYSFLTEDRNKGITGPGFFDILENYSKILTAKPHPVWHYESENKKKKKPNKTVRFVAEPQGKNEEEADQVKQFGKSWKLTQREKCDRIGKLLMDCGLRPNPGDVANKELEKGEYPIPEQYYTDMQAFLESILCLLLAACPQVLDNEDYVGLTFSNIL